jgi:hypothetical protein
VLQEYNACADGVAMVRRRSVLANTASERSSRQSSQGTGASTDIRTIDPAAVMLNKHVALEGVDLTCGTATDAQYTIQFEQQQQQQQQQQQLVLDTDCNSALDSGLLQRSREASLCNTATTSAASQHCVSTPLSRTLCSEFVASDAPVIASAGTLRYGRSQSSSSSGSSSSSTSMPDSTEVVTELQQQTTIESTTVQMVSSVPRCWRHAASRGHGQQQSDTSCVRCIQLTQLAQADQHRVQRALLTWRTRHQTHVIVNGKSRVAEQRAYKHGAHRSLRNGLQKLYARAFVSITLAKIAATHWRLRSLCTLFAQWKEWSIQRSRCAVRYAARQCLLLWRSRSSSSLRAKQCDAVAEAQWQSVVLQHSVQQWQKRAHGVQLQSEACGKGEVFSDTRLLATGELKFVMIRVVCYRDSKFTSCCLVLQRMSIIVPMLY